ncbi:TAXI family TRAP transporter solute-binding subunit [Dactylosporangium sp. NBC_01737]|uniref:TAXI family TRAP transporter solute-binding subunit n=1 Tax=Dactylosporangium sp. NBC_01737 TaxID=2975959 RepID=UPI002E10B6F0|nr:TAXI family TRAP transporter solute-binding subunit [Dactylosporangium sp. NBC_01737]
MRRRTLVAGGLGWWAGSALLAACESGGDEATGTLRIATGSKGAVYYTYGSAIAELAKRYLPHVTASVLPTNASKENVDSVLNGVADVGFTQADIAGDGNKAAPGQLAALARIYDDYVHLVVARDGPIKTVQDLRGRRVSVGQKGSGTAVTADHILEVAGLKDAVIPQPFSLNESVEALRKDEIDAFFFSGGLAVSLIQELAETFAIQLIALDTLVLKLRASFGDYYAERIVPASAYAGINPTVAIGIANYLVVRVSMPEPLAYGVTRLLFEGRDELAKAHQAAARLNIRSAISTPPLPLHPGAVRYYRAQKA